MVLFFLGSFFPWFLFLALFGSSPGGGVVTYPPNTPPDLFPPQTAAPPRSNPSPIVVALLCSTRPAWTGDPSGGAFILLLVTNPNPLGLFTVLLFPLLWSI
jgi:hypothetical protein